MIDELLPSITEYELILASGSPRRKEILSMIGAKFEVVSSSFPETLDKSSFSAPEYYCMENAKQKALEVYHRIKETNKKPFFVIGSDTIVVQGGKILEKPKDKQDAISMLTSLQGCSHQVITSLALVVKSLDKSSEEYKLIIDFNQTEVVFDELHQSEIEAYVNTNDPMDKAGGYGIQGPSALFIKKIFGDYYTVMGFPINLFYKLLRTIDAPDCSH